MTDNLPFLSSSAISLLAAHAVIALTIAYNVASIHVLNQVRSKRLDIYL